MMSATTPWNLYPDAHILIMDDDPVSGLYYQSLVQSQGFQSVGLVQTIEELTSYLSDTLKRNIGLDLFLLDIQMPKLSGIEVCKRLKSHQGFKEVPILMLTGSEDMEDMLKSYQEGAQDFIRKPVNVQELAARMTAALRTHREMQSLKAEAQSSRAQAQQLQEVQSQMQDFAFVDQLTGLPNFQGFEKELKTIWNQVGENYQQLGLIYTEIDRFAQYNEIYGQYKGDQTLNQVAQALSSFKYPTFKIGGTRFGILYPNCNPETLKELGRRINSKIKSQAIPNSESKIGKVLTLSVGGAIVNPDEYGDKSVELINCAEQALLRAKSAGGDSVNVIGISVSGQTIH